MELQEVLNNILYVVLTAIAPIVTGYVVKLIKAKIKESTIISEMTKNQDLENLVENALSDVMDAVLYINQTYVDSLKAIGEFNEEAQKIAFNKAYSKAVSLISEGTRKAIEELYGSFDKWLELKIESSVHIAKK